MPVPDVLRKLLTAPGPSGYEQAAAAVFRDAAAAFADVTHDTVGSTVARVKGTADGPLVAVIGHIDEIGLIVHHIDDEGYLYFSGVGGWDPIILVGQRVAVAATQEEITFAGARTTAFTLRPDIAIVVDVTFATDAPGTEEKELGTHKF